MHYLRGLRRGLINPAIDKIVAQLGECQKWIEDHKGHHGEDCLIWPFHRNPRGYAIVAKAGVRDSRYVHISMCEYRHGPRPTPDHEAGHDCGRGHKGCVNPDHMRWKTKSENQKDRLKHGTDLRGEKSPRAKITAAQAREIRLRKDVPDPILAKEYGIARSTVTGIQNGKGWAHLNG